MYYLGVDPLLLVLLDIELLLFLHSPERSYLLCWAFCAIPCDQMGQRIDVSTPRSRLGLRLAPCYRPPLWPCRAQIRVFATHKSLPSPRRISSPRDGNQTPTLTPSRSVQEHVNELRRKFTLVPNRWRAYAQLARVDRPIGTVLSYLPCGLPSFLPISSISC